MESIFLTVANVELDFRDRVGKAYKQSLSSYLLSQRPGGKAPCFLSCVRYIHIAG